MFSRRTVLMLGLVLFRMTVAVMQVWSPQYVMTVTSMTVIVMTVLCMTATVKPIGDFIYTQQHPLVLDLGASPTPKDDPPSSIEMQEFWKCDPRCRCGERT